jgi:hypothetical protein
VLPVEQRNRVMTGARDLFSQMFVAFADVDQHGAFTHQLGGTFGGDRGHLAHGFVSSV